MELEIARADPAGNITIFVLTPVAGGAARAKIAGALLADPALKAEQAGFVLPPAEPGGLWTLEMMGGEFCGNAARSFGLFTARRAGLAGRHKVLVKISGAARPLPVLADTESGGAWVEMPGPAAEETVEIQGRHFPLYVFEGISHMIAENTEVDEILVRALIQRKGSAAALGLMFYDSRNRFMRPVVWVRATGTTVHESSCGSGTAALGVWALRGLRDGAETIEAVQPGGVITVQAEKKEGRIQRLSIGGQVRLEEPFRYTLPAI